MINRLSAPAKPHMCANTVAHRRILGLTNVDCGWFDSRDVAVWPWGCKHPQSEVEALGVVPRDSNPKPPRLRRSCVRRTGTMRVLAYYDFAVVLGRGQEGAAEPGPHRP
jgi:hypothetical protein